jgi:excinuclease ABC subunit B
MSKPEIEKAIQRTRKAMNAAAKEFNFPEAARLRDEMFALEKLFAEK